MWFFINEIQIGMNDDKLNEWVRNFESEMSAVETEFSSFFKKRNINTYYLIQKNTHSGSFSVKLIDRLDLPSEIIDRITEVYLRSRPL